MSETTKICGGQSIVTMSIITVSLEPGVYHVYAQPQLTNTVAAYTTSEQILPFEFTESVMALQYMTDPDIVHKIGQNDFLDQ